MTKPEARRKLAEIIAAHGVNTPAHLEKATRPAVTLDSIADAWETKLLRIGHSSLRITSGYTHFEHQQKREMAERLLSCTQNGSLYSIAN